MQQCERRPLAPYMPHHAAVPARGLDPSCFGRNALDKRDGAFADQTRHSPLAMAAHTLIAGFLPNA